MSQAIEKSIHDSAAEDATYLKVTWRLIPFLLV